MDIIKNIEEPKIITNTYYDNYKNDDVEPNLNPNIDFSNGGVKNKYTYSSNSYPNIKIGPIKNLNQNPQTSYYTGSTSNSQNEFIEILKQLFILLNIKGNVIRIFGLDKIIVPLLTMFKNWLSTRIPFLNKYIFREKLASLTISYTHFTSTYYNQQNNTSDCLIYRAILNYVYKKKPCGCKYSTNPNGNFMFFEQFPEIQINKYIWMTSTVNNTNTSSIYTLELLSYNSSIEKINKFVKHCSKKFKSFYQDEGIVKSAIKYYKYVGVNNTSHSPIFEEFPFIQTKTFNNIFFTGKEELIKKINYFSKNENSYKELGIPWCLGILLSGKPGTGKTSCIKATASLTKRHIIDICLSKIKSPKELNDIFYNTKINGIDIPFCNRLYILDELDLIIERITDRRIREIKIKELNKIEDRDEQNLNYYNQNQNQNQIQNQIQNNTNNNYGGYPLSNRELNMHSGTNTNSHLQNGYLSNSVGTGIGAGVGVGLEDLLTILDGCVEQNGSLFMATTNHLNLIDKALTRPGRFDICLCLDNSNTKIIEQIIKHFASKHPMSKGLENGVGVGANTGSKISKEYHDKIKKLSKYEGKYVWSPAKITQICLSNIDSKNYYEKIIKNMESEYEDQCNLLD